MDPSDGDRSLSLHLARGVLAAAALWAAFHFYAVIGWPALLLIAVTLWMLRGCPVCWILGLVETVAFKRIALSERRRSLGVRSLY